MTLDGTNHANLPSLKSEVTTFGHVINPLGKNIEDEWNLDTLFFKNAYRMLPMFSFYIYKVDKKIYKNTRGKSGKFTFLWKYVAPYKRIMLVMHWLFKELRVKQGRSLNDRLTSLLNSLFISPEKT